MVPKAGPSLAHRTPTPCPTATTTGSLPQVSIKYQFGDNMWYALASKGYRYGGSNPPPNPSTFKSDSLWNYETGVRLSPAKGLQVDLTAYYLGLEGSRSSRISTL